VTRRRAGTLYGVAAYSLWGLFPLYWPLLKPSGALEILAHRIVWSVLVVAVLLTAGGRWAAMRPYLHNRRQLRLLVCAAAVITVNWLVYIWAVNAHHVVETSLGYFVNPLVTVVLGVVVLGERLSTRQWVAVALAALAVTVIGVDYGRPPWIAIALALSFGTYGLLKNKAAAGAVEGFAIEVSALAPIALSFLVALQLTGHATFGHASVGHDTLLALAGVVTAVPLVLFGAAATRVPLTTLGLLQYIAPTLQFITGVTVDHEALPPLRLTGFAVLWLALVLMTVDGLSRRRRSLAGMATEPA